jgi:MFS family permease
MAMSMSSVFGGMGKALSHPNYRLYWIGQSTSITGRWMQRMAVGWLTWELTESTSWLGVVAFADTIPLLAFTLIAGAIADRVGYFRVMRLSVLGSAAVTAIFAALTISGLITIEWVLALTLLYGSIEAVTYPARMSAVNTLVPRRDLPAAIALGSTTFNGARIIGPAIAGPAILVIGIGGVLAAAAACYFLLAAILFAIRVEETKSDRALSLDMLGDIKDAVHYVMRDPGIWFLMIVLGATGMFIRPYVELLPGFAALAFHRGPDGLALLLSMIGVGAMLGSLWLAWRGRIGGLTEFVGLSLAVMGACQIVFTMVESIYLAGAFMAVSGFCMNGGSSASQTLIQSNVAHAIRARVMSLFVVISWGVPAFGAVAAGWIAEGAGLRATLAAGGALSLALYLWARARAKAAAKELEAAEAAP